MLPASQPASIRGSCRTDRPTFRRPMSEQQRTASTTTASHANFLARRKAGAVAREASKPGTSVAPHPQKGWGLCRLWRACEIVAPKDCVIIHPHVRRSTSNKSLLCAVEWPENRILSIGAGLGIESMNRNFPRPYLPPRKKTCKAMILGERSVTYKHFNTNSGAAGLRACVLALRSAAK